MIPPDDEGYDGDAEQQERYRPGFFVVLIILLLICSLLLPSLIPLLSSLEPPPRPTPDPRNLATPTILLPLREDTYGFNT